MPEYMIPQGTSPAPPLRNQGRLDRTSNRPSVAQMDPSITGHGRRDDGTINDVRRILPGVAQGFSQQLDRVREDVIGRLERQAQDQKAEMKRMNDLLETLSAQIDTFIRGQFTFQPATTPLLPFPNAPVGTQQALSTQHREPMENHPPTSNISMPESTPAVPPSPRRTAVSPNSPTSPGQNIHNTMSRSVVTVPDLWQEWMKGLNGRPSIQSLDASYGPRWRATSREKMFYGRRKMIIDEIHARCPNGEAFDLAVQNLETFRKQNSLSLNALSSWVKLHRTGLPEQS